MATLSIAGHTIGPGRPAFVIAEVAQAHDGSLGMAHAFIDAAADAGADAVKFQTHVASAESTLDEPFRVHFSRQDPTRLHYWKRMEFTFEQWEELAAHARQLGLVFLSSAFSLAAVELLQKIGVDAWKIGSGEFASRDLWEVISATGKPILFSTGLAKWTEIGNAVALFRSKGLCFGLLQCTSIYPSRIEEIGLNVIKELHRKFGCPVGLSDHSGSVFPGLAALARGANILEVHLTFHRGMFGPDVPASLTIDELRMLCTMRDALVKMDAHPVDKDDMAERLTNLREIFGRSVAPVRPLSAGAVLCPQMLVLKKPAGGIPPDALEQVAGRRLARDVTPEHILHWNDLEDET